MKGEPLVHKIIGASAGSGKTHQLTNRYLALLALGIEPEAILATTFTRKAAGEILDRILSRLAEAAAESKEARELATEIHQNTFTPKKFAELLRKFLANLHRARVGTLDSFTVSLARSFAFELGLPAGWSICEDIENAALQREALEHLFESNEADLLNALYRRLTHGETRRGVQEELSRIVDGLYPIYRDTRPESWNKVKAPPGLLCEELQSLLARLEAFDLSKHPRMEKPRSEDVERARSEEWEDFLGKGLAAKVLSGENAFYSKPIPGELVGFYERLIQHARSALVQPLALQTVATRELLDRFHSELWSLKQAGGGLRFDEVTRTVAAALERQTLQPESLAFRLDGAIEHLLLDEFQDTSLSQWRVLQPMATGITRASARPRGSFFCVGDVKQAIYGWRGGMAEIMGGLPELLGLPPVQALLESRRSAQPIIDVVNQVFGSLSQFQGSDKCQDGLTSWRKRFERHSTVQKELPGYVAISSGPAHHEGQSLPDQRGAHCKFVAEQIGELVKQLGGRSIGVLCRTNDTVARMIYELRRKKAEASEEGGNPLTDSPAVELVLSLLTLADHPGHSAAWFHLQNSPLREHFESLADAESLARRLRHDLIDKGYGPFMHGWAKKLAPACDQRDLGRLQQLVEMAYAHQVRSNLRTDDFVAWVREERVPDPSGVTVRVMTIHSAKGLQFDAVVLPELDANLMGQAPSFVVGREPPSLDVSFVCRYANETVQQLLESEQRSAFLQDRRQRVEESLSLLYVAMTRAIHALYMYIPGARNRSQKDAWYNLLRQTLAPEAPKSEDTLLFEHGNANWFQQAKAPAKQVSPPQRQAPQPITFRKSETDRRRGLKYDSPSRREGRAQVRLNKLFNPQEGTGTSAGTLYHAWFAKIAWLDDGVPSDEVLHAAAKKACRDLPANIWDDYPTMLGTFRTWLQDTTIASVLKRTAYADPQQEAFPQALAPIWKSMITQQTVEQERRFLVRDGASFLNGSFDRIVWLSDGERTVAADVIDFKTDAISPSDTKGLEERTEFYRPQLEAYRRAAARLGGLSEERIATRLVFTVAGCVREI